MTISTQPLSSQSTPEKIVALVSKMDWFRACGLAWPCAAPWSLESWPVCRISDGLHSAELKPSLPIRVAHIGCDSRASRLCLLVVQLDSSWVASPAEASSWHFR